jgi:hypothetical protein
MAYNKDEEHLINPTENQSENPPDEIIPTTDTETSNPNQETENMEVHHHTHDPAAPHHKKNWKSYFWEFLMLFLAVFCGFLAEYQLEHVIEQSREKQYGKLLLADLRADSTYFIKRIQDVEAKMQKHKAFFELMTSSVIPTDKQIINSFLPLFYSYPMSFTPGTYNQMKTSGSLRYIQNQNLINELQKYYEVQIPRSNISVNLGLEYYQTILYPYFLNHFRIQDIDDTGDSVIVANPIIINRTKQTNQELLNLVANYGSDQKNFFNKSTIPLIEKNKELINIINENYDFR